MYNKYKWNEFKEIEPYLKGANSLCPQGLKGFDDVVNFVLIIMR
jgi:hypothetical protein